MVRRRHEPSLREKRGGFPRRRVTFGNCRPASNFLIAIDGGDADNWTDPETLKGLARQATRLTVVEAEPKTLDLTLKVIR